MSHTEMLEPEAEGAIFHRGERMAQQRAGVLEKMAARGGVAIRSYMPDQHREFFAQLPFIVVGSIDGEQQPWASVLVGAPGFVSSPDPEHLVIRAHALTADPLNHTLAPQAMLGLLGIEPHTRRRNRMNGKVEQMSGDGFTLKVDQSFGNCPKYIQARKPQLIDITDHLRPPKVVRSASLDAAMQSLIADADTFFIATAFSGKDAGSGRQYGVDVSHRGGKPGFIRIDDSVTLTVPDFVGNFFFNTIGNLIAHPRAGLLFIDYASGDLLYLAVDVELIWDGPEVTAFQGAQRVLRFHLRQAMRVAASLPLRWGAAEMSPALAGMGRW